MSSDRDSNLMRPYEGRFVPRLPSVTVSTTVLFLTGGLVGVMAYEGAVAPFVWVVAVLLGVALAGRFPRSDAAWRTPASLVALAVAGGVLGVVAYGGTLALAPAFAVSCLVALGLAPESTA